MFFGAVGDLHGDFDALDRIMARHPEVAFWVCPGDLAAEDGEYPQPRAPLYWIKGNNEDFDFVAAQPPGSGTLPNLHYIPNGVSVQAHGLTLAGLGGTFAPTWYEKPASELRRLSPRDDRRRHFVHEEVDACKALQGVDIFLSHEAARPFPLPRVKDAGKTPINEVLAGDAAAAASVRPPSPVHRRRAAARAVDRPRQGVGVLPPFRRQDPCSPTVDDLI